MLLNRFASQKGRLLAPAVLLLTMGAQMVAFASVTQPKNGKEVGDFCDSSPSVSTCVITGCAVLYGLGTINYEACLDNAAQEIRLLHPTPVLPNPIPFPA